MHKADQKFSQWCKEHGFGDMNPRVRADAMWLAEQGGGFQPLETDLSHPTRIRQWHRDTIKTEALPADLLDPTATTKQKLELEDRAAERYAKTINRGKSGGEGSDIAQRHVEALAKKHGVTVGELEEATATAAARLALPQL